MEAWGQAEASRLALAPVQDFLLLVKLDNLKFICNFGFKGEAHVEQGEPAAPANRIVFLGICLEQFFLDFREHWKSPGGLVKTKTSGPSPTVSDSMVLGLALEFAFVTSSQILLMRPHFENWSTEGWFVETRSPYMPLQYNWDSRIFKSTKS